MQLREVWVGAGRGPFRDCDTVVQLVEGRTYRLVPRADERLRAAWFAGRSIASIGGDYDIALHLWSGGAELRWVTDVGEDSVRVVVVPDPDKVSHEAWRRMLGDLEAWQPGVTVGLEAGRRGRVGENGYDALFLVEALLPLLPELEVAFSAIAIAPREIERDIEGEMSLPRIRRASVGFTRWRSNHPVPVEGPSHVASEFALRALVPTTEVVDSLDHAANRYVIWLLARIAHTLDRTAGDLKSLSGHGRGDRSDDAKGWCAQRATDCSAAAMRLRERWRRSRLRNLMPAPASEGVLAVILNDPRYARFHRVARLFRAPRFRDEAEQGGLGAAVRPTYSLYEVWAWLAVCRAVAARLAESEPDRWSWALHDVADIFRFTAQEKHTRWVGTRDDGSILTSHFNLKFPSFFVGRPDAGELDPEFGFSISAERRPDVAITWLPVDGRAPSWMVLDAKYRVGRSNLGDAFASLHIYHDALRWARFGGRCVGALILSPRRTNDCSDWFGEKFWNEYGVGAEEVVPGGERVAFLGQRVLGSLGVTSSPTILHDNE